MGLVAGLSSGFLGIGGGLAIVVGLSACLKLPQHQAQMIGFLWGGTDLGSRLANYLGRKTLSRVLVAMVTAMAWLFRD